MSLLYEGGESEPSGPDGGREGVGVSSAWLTFTGINFQMNQGRRFVSTQSWTWVVKSFSNNS